jgi:molecular chaperone HtpG
MTIDNFLIPDLNQIRHSIRDIDDSYNNDWDLLAELCQNAVDAIRSSDRNPGEIELEINSLQRSISIKDNGIGIDPDELPKLLKPFATNKVGRECTVGEKGVGLTYVMFSSNYFEITSGNSNGTSRGVIKNARSWKQQNDNIGLPLDHQYIQDEMAGTKVTLNEIDDLRLFSYSYEQLKFILLTRTALGNTTTIWKSDKDIRISLRYLDQNNNLHEEHLPFNYWFVTNNLSPTDVIDLEDFISFASSADKSDLDKRRKLQDKIIFKKGSIIHNTDNREINYLACFVPTRSTWNKLTSHFRLASEEQLTSSEYVENFGYARFQDGITVSVKGMPTGISIDRPSTGFAGYWSNIFIIFEDRKLKFDIGRKAIHGSMSRIYKNYAKDIFNDFLKYVKYMSGEVPVDEDWEKDEVFGEINSIIDLGVDLVSFRKCPKDQEASVAAIFFECLGRGYVKEIVPLISGYRNKYDLYALWGHKKVIIEFKSKLRNIIRDFSDEQKMFNHLDCVVCWDVDEDDRQTFSDIAISLQSIQRGLLAPLTHTFPNATHKLTLANFIDPIYVIDMKQFLETLPR